MFFFCRIAVFCLFPFMVYGQDLSQTVRGTVRDKISGEMLPGATVEIRDSSFNNSTFTDAQGTFRISHVTLGRHTIKISFIGYKTIWFPVIVTSGKEVVVQIELEQMVIEHKEVEVVAHREKDKVNNNMTSVSARSFTIEETSRYAGSLGDPARMASNYAGVTGANDTRNDIIIRGNSPVGVLWRLNGVDIPNPNHFGTLGTTGGPISILNNNQLDKSDFLTGAFPAEYGNALAGVFDLQMRQGNNEKREYLVQTGFNGFELGAEGPYKKGKNGTYLINYRYSTLAIFTKLGIDFGAGSAVPQYQDLSFRTDMNLPGNAGNLIIFGLGGFSYAEILQSKAEPGKRDIYSRGREDTYYGTNMGMLSLQHTYFFNKNAYSKLTLSLSGSGNRSRVDSLGGPDKLQPFPFYGARLQENRKSLQYIFYKKLSSRDSYKVGVTLENRGFALHDSLKKSWGFKDLSSFSGDAWLIQSFIQTQHKFSDHFYLNAGLHHQYFSLNTSSSLEPRAGLVWESPSGNTYGLGWGIHSQLQPLYIYFVQTTNQDGSRKLTNTGLDFTRSTHYVFSWDRNLGKDFRIKTELYYQFLTKVPVETKSSEYSVLNEGADFGFRNVDSLVNNGKGQNLGIELTLEKFLSRGYYFLLTGSVFDSKYRGSDGIWRNTAFNSSYVFNILGGKEWTIRKKNVLSLNLRTTLAGGKHYIPLDEEKSRIFHDAVYDYGNAYTPRFRDYFRTDIKISYRKNSKKMTQEFSLDINNIFNTKNIFIQRYDPLTGEVRTEYQIGFFPIPQYRIYF